MHLHTAGKAAFFHHQGYAIALEEPHKTEPHKTFDTTSASIYKYIKKATSYPSYGLKTTSAIVSEEGDDRV
jgi:hypothetical protein